MSKEEKEAIEYIIKDEIKHCEERLKFEHGLFVTNAYEEKLKYCKTLLNLIEKLQNETNHFKNLYHTADATTERQQQELQLRDKVIKEIIEEYELYDRINIKNYCDENLRKNNCIRDCANCIKQYFINKVKENNI